MADSSGSFLEDHEKMSDDKLGIMPETRLTPLHMFVSTFEARIGGINLSIIDFIDQITPSGVVKAINCNFGHKSQSEYEHLLKLERKPTRKRGTKFQLPVRARKLQGDGTCFNSTVEPVIVFDDNPDKVYKVKCFTSTGVIQVPGVINYDLSDGVRVITEWIEFVNSQLENDTYLISYKPIMLNYNCQVVRSTPRIVLNLGEFVRLLEETECSKYPIQEIKAAQEDMKIAFKFLMGEKTVRVNVFLRGKINVLGAKLHEHAHFIYNYIADLFCAHWGDLIIIRPNPDAE